MQDGPGPIEILAAVTAFLREDLLPKLDQTTAHHTRVAANALELVAREMMQGDAADGAERARLQALLGREGSTEELSRALADAIRADAVEVELPRLLDHLRETTLAKLAIDQPRYAGYLRARALWGGKDRP